VGSEGSAAGGRRSDPSEWPGSVSDAAAPSARRAPGTPTGEIRRTDFSKCQSQRQIQVLPPQPKKPRNLPWFFFDYMTFYSKMEHIKIHLTPTPGQNWCLFVEITVFTTNINEKSKWQIDLY